MVFCAIPTKTHAMQRIYLKFIENTAYQCGAKEIAYNLRGIP